MSIQQGFVKKTKNFWKASRSYQWVLVNFYSNNYYYCYYFCINNFLLTTVNNNFFQLKSLKTLFTNRSSHSEIFYSTRVLCVWALSFRGFGCAFNKLPRRLWDHTYAWLFSCGFVSCLRSILFGQHLSRTSS